MTPLLSGDDGEICSLYCYFRIVVSTSIIWIKKIGANDKKRYGQYKPGYLFFVCFVCLFFERNALNIIDSEFEMGGLRNGTSNNGC